MKILLTCHVRFASAMAWYTLHLARGLRTAGHDVFLYAQRMSPLADWARAEELLLNDDFDFHTTNPLELARAVRHLHATFHRFKPDVLNPHCPPGHALVAWVNRSRGLPVVRTVAEPRPPKSNLINRWIHERRTDAMIYSTASSLPRYRTAFRFARQIEEVIHPGLDLALFPAVATENWRARLNVPAHALFGAIVARLSPEKGQELLIEALALLSPAERNQFVVLLTGDDNRQRSAADLRALAQNRGVVDSLRFESRLADVRPLLAEIDVGIITSVRSEAVCRIALEYMAYAKPIISTDVNILAEVVRDGVNGWSVPVGDAAAMANALRRALTERDRLPMIGESGRTLVETEWSLSQQTAQTVSLFQRLLVEHA
ncbi:MAG: glycosyltransferase family 4 protein [bacterium]|nr:glycosyltransferase family 4 protein [bacterium]